jgi:ABC-type Fe3+/spermidine/putrescine transport system ATPase subunit
MTAHVELTGISKLYGDAVAVEGLDLAIPEGSFTCLLGPSGCGKTTTLRMIAGFVEPTEGDVRIRGVSQRGVPPNKRPTSIVFQDYALFPHMSVAKNVGYGLRVQRLSKAEVSERVGRTLELLDLDRLADRLPRQLSGGQQQRVALARSLVTEPDVILMDEPLSNLDAKMRVRLRAELQSVQRRLGLTTVYVTHDQEEALSMGDLVAVMDQGLLQQLGSPTDLYRRPANRFVADFIGLNNFVEARCVEVDERRIELQTDDGATLVAEASTQRERHQVGDRVWASFRPEQVGVADGTGSTEANAFQGEIKARQFLGSMTRYIVESGGVDLIYDDHRATDDFRSGPITLSVAPEALRVFSYEEASDDR